MQEVTIKFFIPVIVRGRTELLLLGYSLNVLFEIFSKIILIIYGLGIFDFKCSLCVEEIGSYIS